MEEYSSVIMCTQQVTDSVPSIHACALSRGGVSQAEMPRAPFKLKGEGSEEAGQEGLL